MTRCSSPTPGCLVWLHGDVCSLFVWLFGLWNSRQSETSLWRCSSPVCVCGRSLRSPRWSDPHTGRAARFTRCSSDKFGEKRDSEKFPLLWEGPSRVVLREVRQRSERRLQNRSSTHVFRRRFLRPSKQKNIWVDPWMSELLGDELWITITLPAVAGRPVLLT